MAATGLDTFDTTIQTTNIWLDELMQELGWTDRHKAWYALRAVLHTLRDRLPAGEAVQLAAQLPMLIRGMYYEGWTPQGKPVRERTRDEFIAHISEAFVFDVETDPRSVIRAVLQVLTNHVTAGEIDDVRATLPAGVRDLWP